MLRPRGPLPLVLSLASLFALLAAPAVRAEEAGFEPRVIRDRSLPRDPSLPVPMLDGTAAVTAGQRRWIRWRAPGPEVEELELLLSVDDGRRFVLRVSPELPGAEDRYEWRVPNLSAARARLRLRMRIHGREIESEIGEPFSIEADLERPIDRDLVHEGAWWTGPTAGGGRVPAAFGSGFPGARLARASESAACDAPQRTSLPAAPVVTALDASAGPAPAPVAPRGRDAFLPPRRTPLRA